MQNGCLEILIISSKNQKITAFLGVEGGYFSAFLPCSYPILYAAPHIILAITTI